MSIELVDAMGDDRSVANAARVSLHKRVVDQLSAADEQLIFFLMRNHHASPFEHVVFSFRVRTSIKVAREWFRHRTDSFNEESTRYVEMRPDFYLPEGEAVRKQVGRPGAYRLEPLSGPGAALVPDVMRQSYEASYETYNELLRAGVARELASFVLPLGLLTEFIWTVKLRHVLHFLALRTSEQALYEMRLEAQAVEQVVMKRCPVSYAAWDTVGRPLLDADWD